LNKFEKTGVEIDTAKDSPMRDFYDQERFERIKKMFEDKGIGVLNQNKIRRGSHEKRLEILSGDGPVQTDPHDCSKI